MDTLIIFCAKYLVAASALVATYAFFTATRRTRKEMLVLGIIALPLTYVVAKLAGHFYFDPRPFVTGARQLIPHSPDNGFPSDHTLLAAGLAAVVWPFRHRAGVVLGILAIVVGFARVAAGVHHSVDIIGSIVIAFAVAAFVYACMRRAWKR